LIAFPLYLVIRLGLLNFDDALGSMSGLDLSGYNAPSVGYGAPSPSYSPPAPAPSYTQPAPSYSPPAPAPSYSAPSPSVAAPSPSYQSTGYNPSPGSNTVSVPGDGSPRISNPLLGSYFQAKADYDINLDYQDSMYPNEIYVQAELEQLNRLRELLSNGGRSLSSGPYIAHPRVDFANTWNGLPGS